LIEVVKLVDEEDAQAEEDAQLPEELAGESCNDTHVSRN